MPHETIKQAMERLIQNAEAIEESLECVADHEDVVPDLRKHASNHWWWAQLAAYAEEIYKQHEHALENAEADCRRQARIKLREAGEKCTEQQVEDTMRLMSVYQSFQRQCDARYGLWRRLQAVAKSLDVRTSMLQSINARQQKELSLQGQLADDSYEHREDRPSIAAPRADIRQRYDRRHENATEG